MQVAVFSIKGTSNIINPRRCSHSAADRHWQLNTQQGNHSFSWFHVKSLSLPRLHGRVSRWPSLWCNQRELSLSQAHRQTVYSFSEHWPTFKIYISDHSVPLHKSFLPFLVKTKNKKSNFVECDCLQAQVCAKSYRLGVFLEVFFFNSLFHFEILSSCLEQLPSQTKEEGIQVGNACRVDVCDSNRTGKCAVWLRTILALHPDKHKAELMPATYMWLNWMFTV